MLKRTNKIACTSSSHHNKIAICEI